MTLLDQPEQTREPTRKGGSGFYKPKGWGIFGLGPVGSVIVAIAGFAVIATVLTPYTLTLSVVIIVATALFLVWASWPDRHGRTSMQRWNASRSYRAAKRAGTNLYLPGSLTDMGTHRLPGALAPSSLSSWTTADGEEFAVLMHPKTHLYVVTATCQPDGASLLDEAAIGKQVDNYGHLLASLAQEPDFVQGIVTVEVAPNSGPLMRKTIAAQESPRAHSLSKAIMADIVDQYPQGSQGVEVSFTATFRAPAPEIGLDGKKVPRADRPEEAQQVGELLAIRAPHLFGDLPECGAGAVRLMGPDELIERVRVAYNPADRAAYDAARATGQSRPVTLWTNAGPSGSQAHWNYYRHGGGASITWEFTGFTTPVIQADGLLPLLETGVNSSTRISIIYQPIDPARSSSIVENNYNAAEGRVRDARKPTARQHKLMKDASKARDSEADGHALLDFAVLVTSTVQDEKDLPKLRALITRLGPSARLNLRPCDGQQEVMFAQGLGPLGMIADRHLRLPRGLMNGI